MVEKLLLQCGHCGTLLKSAEKAEEHAKENWHTNFRESNEEFVYLVCKVCGKQCVCKTVSYKLFFYYELIFVKLAVVHVYVGLVVGGDRYLVE